MKHSSEDIQSDLDFLGQTLNDLSMLLSSLLGGDGVNDDYIRDNVMSGLERCANQHQSISDYVQQLEAENTKQEERIKFLEMTSKVLSEKLVNSSSSRKASDIIDSEPSKN